jgi:hypothetical protein
LMKFFDALFQAVKGEPRPKFLWSTVNLVGVEWEKDGNGKREEVVLM